MLFISIVRTIRTNPGNIPEDKEWDMQTDSMAESNPSSSEDDNGEVGFSSDNSKRNEAPKVPIQGIEYFYPFSSCSRPLTNDAIEEDAEEPKEA
jgi:hypothetical protein